MKRKRQKRRRAELALAQANLVRARELIGKARDYMAFLSALLDFHDCERCADLPEDAYGILIDRDPFASAAEKLERVAWYRGEIEAEARLPKLLDRLRMEFLEDFSGPEQ